MKNLIKAALTVILVIATVQVMNAQIKGSAHDLSAISGGTTTQICVFCHTPHSQSETSYLWNRRMSSASYTMYSSPTMMNAAATPGNASLMCLSCHDGTVAFNSLLNAPGSGSDTTTITTSPNTMTGWDTIGVNLSNDHPIGMIYNDVVSSKSSGYRSPHDGSPGVNAYVLNGTIKLPLSGDNSATATVECTSCHDPHNTSVGEFLRVSNTGSQMCLTCHVK